MCRFQGRDINTYLSVFVCVSAMGARQSIVSGRKHFGVPILRNPHMVATANHVSLQIYSLHRCICCIGIWETASSPCSQRWQGTLSIAHAITHLSTRSDEFIFTCQTWSFLGDWDMWPCDPNSRFIRRCCKCCGGSWDHGNWFLCFWFKLAWLDIHLWTIIP